MLCPAYASFRPVASATALMAASLCRLDANCVLMILPLPWWSMHLLMRFFATSTSDVVRPGDSTLVESLMRSVAPSAPIRSKASRSNVSPSIGDSSIFQSPVCTMVPSSHLKTHPQQSGMEWVTRIVSTEKGPAWNWAPISNVTKRSGSHRLYSRILLSTSCITNGQAYTLQRGSSAGTTQGMAPMWSSWPWVITRASIRSRHWCRKEVSGRIFCMPRSSWSGNSSPASSMM
mmetsp:Transcript_11085/g.31102  ORF Transcript_11085/g.31102 Transcript_11085/m.31102 type:complete len:232 (+) Transcript_11085:2492-3187(+)